MRQGPLLPGAKVDDKMTYVNDVIREFTWLDVVRVFTWLRLLGYTLG